MNKKLAKKKTRLAGKLIRSAVAATVLIHAYHALVLGTSIEYKHVPFRSRKIPPGLDGCKIALVTDVHHISTAWLEDIAAELNAQNVDLLMLGGDFADCHSPCPAIEILSQVKTTYGIFGVAGNHDNPGVLFAAMRKHGITPLSNSGIHARGSLYIAGVEDLRQGKPNITQATSGANPGDFVILVSHNPDVFMRQDTKTVDLALSGHTHGGEITFFGVWAPALGLMSECGHRFRSGWAESHDGTPVYVSNGLGTHSLRVFARPQVIIFTLHSDLSNT